jgi:hypothetical protein
MIMPDTKITKEWIMSRRRKTRSAFSDYKGRWQGGRGGLFLKAAIYRIIPWDGNSRPKFSEGLPAIGFASGECRAGQAQEIHSR